MLIYIALVLFLIILNLLCKPNTKTHGKKVFCIIAGITIFFLMAFREYTVGADTIQYCNQFTRMLGMSLSEMISYSRYEVGFLCFFKLVSMFTTNPQWIIIFSSAIISYSITYFIYHNSKNSLFSFLIFILLNYYFMSMTAMRQYLAIAFIIIGFSKYIKNTTAKKNKLTFLIYILIGALFHSTSLLLIPLVFIPTKFKYSKLLLLFTIIFSIACIPIAPKIFNVIVSSTKYNVYVDSVYYEGSQFAGFLNFLVSTIFLLFAFNFTKDKRKDFKYNFYLLLLSINTIIYALSINVSIFTRLNSFFDIFNVVFLANILLDIRDSYTRKIMVILFSILLFIFWLIICIYRPEWYGCIPYSFFK